MGAGRQRQGTKRRDVGAQDVRPSTRSRSGFEAWPALSPAPRDPTEGERRERWAAMPLHRVEDSQWVRRCADPGRGRKGRDGSGRRDGPRRSPGARETGRVVRGRRTVGPTEWPPPQQPSSSPVPNRRPASEVDPCVAGTRSLSRGVRPLASVGGWAGASGVSGQPPVTSACFLLRRTNL